MFCNKNKKYAKEKAKIFIDNIEITQVNYIKFLDVIVDENTTWKQHHIECVCNKTEVIWHFVFIDKPFLYFKFVLYFRL